MQLLTERCVLGGGVLSGIWLAGFVERSLLRGVCLGVCAQGCVFRGMCAKRGVLRGVCWAGCGRGTGLGMVVVSVAILIAVSFPSVRNGSGPGW